MTLDVPDFTMRINLYTTRYLRSNYLHLLVGPSRLTARIRRLLTPDSSQIFQPTSAYTTETNCQPNPTLSCVSYTK